VIVVSEARGTVELSGKIANRALWKLPQVWKHRTLPHLLGNHRTVSTSFRKGPLFL
jgi:hypothetical protein